MQGLFLCAGPHFVVRVPKRKVNAMPKMTMWQREVRALERFEAAMRKISLPARKYAHLFKRAFTLVWLCKSQSGFYHKGQYAGER